MDALEIVEWFGFVDLAKTRDKIYVMVVAVQSTTILVDSFFELFSTNDHHQPANAQELFSQPDVDGGLVGGASLKADDFSAIIQAG